MDLATGAGSAVLLVEGCNAVVVNALLQRRCERCRSQNGVDEDEAEADHFQVFRIAEKTFWVVDFGVD